VDIKRSYSRILSLCIGNLLEHYDTALFGFLSCVLAPVIFPEKEPLSALILTYAIIPVAMLARPVGSLLFGFIGDYYGRATALSLSLIGMGLVSLLMAIGPSFIAFGLSAPLFWCLTRALQNFLAAGETCGGAIFLLESSQNKEHDILSSLYSASTIGGILLASIATTLLSTLNQIETGWGYLYLFGSITALFGYLIRRRIKTDQIPDSDVSPSDKKKLSIGVLWLYRRQLLSIAVCSGFSYANYSIALIVLSGFIPLVSDQSQQLMIPVNTALLVIDLLLLPLFGYLASKISRYRLMLVASLSACITCAPLFFLLQGASFGIILLIRIFFVVIGAAFAAPMHALLQTWIPKAHRYSVISFGYAIGSQLLGGPSATLTLWLFKTTGSYFGMALYWIILATATSVVLARASIKDSQGVHQKVLSF
jgi:MFS family permease